VGGAATLFSPLTSKAAVPGNRAAVCIFLSGGNDSNNMIVPLDPAAYATYTAGRGELALSKSDLLMVNSSNQKGTFGFHPQLPELAGLYNSGRLAVLANVGVLPRPMNKAQAIANVPANLSSHTSGLNMAFLPPGVIVDPWTLTLQPGTASPQVFNFGGVTMTSPVRLSIPGPTSDNPQITALMANTNFRTVFPNTVIGSQLLRVAKLLKLSSDLGIQRPVFSCIMGGWDTRYDELYMQADLFGQLSKAMSAFLSATEEMGITDQVVTYTKTEFNRTLKPNATQGTDSAWGGHELIMGGSVRGGDIYGAFPSLVLGGPNDIGATGVWFPTTSDDQYAATIAYWYGLGMGQLQTAIPKLKNFPTPTLGFL
jgi:uncharacterized protein (DUF1501 family)